ncbi:TPA: hypothetical protein ACJCW2_001162 [Yersinia enterocolitica]
MKVLSTVLLTVLSFVVGALCLYGLIHHFGVDKISVPSPIIAVLVLPLAYCLQAIYKLSDLKESQQLTGDEVRRLFYIIDIKRGRLFTCIVFYFMSAVFVGISIMVSDGGPLFRAITLTISGGLLGVTIYTVFIIYSLMNEVTNFKAKLVRREQDEKHRKMD